MFKKILSFAMAAMMVISISTSALASQTNVFDKNAFVQEIAANNFNFTSWETGIISDGMALYNSTTNSIGSCLYTVTDHAGNILGYFIYDVANGYVSEYAKGDSPYGEILTEYKKIKFGSSDIECINYYDGPTFYGVSLAQQLFSDENSQNIYDFTKDNTVSIDLNYSNKKLMPFGNDSTSRTVPASKLLDGVGDVDWHLGCVPIGANLRKNALKKRGNIKGFSFCSIPFFFLFSSLILIIQTILLNFFR